MNVFRNEEGATSLAVVLAIMLSITLLGACIQQYWVNSSSRSIQAVADASAIAAGDAIAKTVFVVQVIDAIVLTSNLFGLVLHAVVIVAGIAVAIGLPALGPLPSLFLSKAVEFDKQYVELRKSMISQLAAVCRAMSAVTPVAANIQAADIANKASGVGRKFSDREYSVVVLPIPLTGSIECDEPGAAFDSFEDKVINAGETNEEDAAELRGLEERLEDLRRKCFNLDIYRDASVSFQYWTPSKALVDFEKEWNSIGAQIGNGDSPINPLEDTFSSRAAINDLYQNDSVALWKDKSPLVDRALQSVSSSGYLTPLKLDIDDAMTEYYTQSILVVPHSPNERKAYHSTDSCLGLSNASETPEYHSVSFVFADYDHPPCLICEPLHWGALMNFAGTIGDYVAAWNQECEAILEYENTRREIDELQGKISSRTNSAMESIIDRASAYLSSGRITYRPAGERGLIAIVTSAGGVSIPKFALPAVTGDTSFKLGDQIAMAGARLVESKKPGGVRAALEDIGKSSASQGGLGLALRVLLGRDDGALNKCLSLWGACLEVYTDGINGLASLMKSLPWGLDTLAARQVNKLVEEAGLSKPDLRRIEARLVPTGLVGDAEMSGAEGEFVRALREAKILYAKSANFDANAIGSALDSYTSEYADRLFGSSAEVDDPLVLGQELKLPYSDDAVFLFGEIARGLIDDVSDISRIIGD